MLPACLLWLAPHQSLLGVHDLWLCVWCIDAEALLRGFAGTSPGPCYMTCLYSTCVPERRLPTRCPCRSGRLCVHV